MQVSADLTNTNQWVHNINQTIMCQLIIIFTFTIITILTILNIIFELILQWILEETNEIAVRE